MTKIETEGYAVGYSGGNVADSPYEWDGVTPWLTSEAGRWEGGYLAGSARRQAEREEEQDAGFVEYDDCGHVSGRCNCEADAEGW